MSPTGNRITEVILQVPNPAGSIPGGFSFVHVTVTSEEMPASAFADMGTHLRAALRDGLVERPDPDRYGPWLEACWPSEVLAGCRSIIADGPPS